MANIVIVGAGAAGLFAAGTALALGHRVTVVEHSGGLGKKLLITGKGRCNLTNACDEAEFLQNVRHNPRFLYSALAALPPATAMELFEDRLALPLKTERGRRVFPASDRAQDVLDALQRYAEGMRLVRGSVKKLLVEEGRAAGVVLGDGSRLPAAAVLVATGGLSYPVTGSNGDGYRLAKEAGHSIVKPVPSLVSLVERGSLCKRMMGLSLRNVQLTLEEDGRPVFRENGEMLFTHFGLSGPLVLSASAYIDELEKRSYTAVIDLKPALDEEMLDKRLQRDLFEFSNRGVAHCLDKLLPAKMRPVMLELWGLDPARKANSVTREERRVLGGLVKGLRIPVKDRGDLQHAVITAGGVDVREVSPKTMESKKLPGLFFAGEVLDVDAYTGGYNLHIAWCTAWAAAHGFPV